MSYLVEALQYMLIGLLWGYALWRIMEVVERAVHSS